MGKGWEEGFSGSCIKDTWTKPKGDRIQGEKWGWLGWWGCDWGIGYKCVQTTMKKKFKKMVIIIEY